MDSLPSLINADLPQRHYGRTELLAGVAVLSLGGVLATRLLGMIAKTALVTSGTLFIGSVTWSLIQRSGEQQHQGDFKTFLAGLLNSENSGFQEVLGDATPKKVPVAESALNPAVVEKLKGRVDPERFKRLMAAYGAALKCFEKANEGSDTEAKDKAKKTVEYFKDLIDHPEKLDGLGYKLQWIGDQVIEIAWSGFTWAKNKVWTAAAENSAAADGQAAK